MLRKIEIALENVRSAWRLDLGKVKSEKKHLVSDAITVKQFDPARTWHWRSCRPNFLLVQTKLLSLSDNIPRLRSDNRNLHGGDKLLRDPSNSVSADHTAILQLASILLRRHFPQARIG